jgi:type III pantothenate kinase
MQLVIDVGNTRIKWALIEAGGLVDTQSALHRGEPDSALSALAAALPDELTRAIVANVAGDAFGSRLTQLLRARAGITPELVAVQAEAHGVRCGYADPSRLGVDRWIAVLAAHHHAPGAACVVDAGTAATFDAVDAGGQHLGGLIIPGPRLLAAALDRNTSDIGATAAVEAAPDGLDLLGRTTDAAVGHGSWLAVAAAIDRAVATVEKALGERPTVYLTGGDAPMLSAWLETKVQLRADLVLEGLALFGRPTFGSQESSPKGTHA